MKKISFLFWLLLMISLAAELTVYVDAHRVLDEAQNTTYNINYEIPYSSMKFIPTKYGYGAQIDVEFTLKKGEKERTQKFSNNVILTEFYKTVSDDTYLDKLVITLSKSGYAIDLNFIDNLSKENRLWSYTFEQLPPSSFMSDIEFSNQVVVDTTSYLEKFHRDEKLFLVNTSHIFTQEKQDDFVLYYEVYSGDVQSESATETITLSTQQEVIRETTTDILLSNWMKPVERLIDISQLESGLYELQITIQAGANQMNRSDHFSIKKDTYVFTRFFNETEDEFELVKMFLNSNEKSAFRDLSDSEKMYYIDRFWKSKDPNPATKENEIVVTIQNRINQANQQFGYFKNAGWKTDRGRIYIKHGEPDETVKTNTNIYNTDVTDEAPKLFYTTAGTKDFQVWKYRSNYYETYIFIDLYNNRGFKLIYAGNDDSEVSLANWQEYVGGDKFDESLLD